MRLKFRLTLSQNGQHQPCSDEKVFSTLEEAEREQRVLNAGLMWCT